MKSMIVMSILFTACGMPKTDQAIADKINAGQLPEISNVKTVEPAADKKLPSMPDVISAPDTAAKTVPDSQVVTADEVSVLQDPVTKVVVPPEIKLLSTRTCATYSQPTYNFKMTTEFFDDYSQKHTVFFGSNGSGNQVYIPETVVVQKFTGLEIKGRSIDFLLPMSPLSQMSFLPTNPGNMWRVSIQDSTNSVPVLFHSAKDLGEGRSIVGDKVDFHSWYTCNSKKEVMP